MTRYIQGYNEAEITAVFETHLAASAARVEHLTTLPGGTVRRALGRMVAKGEISRGGTGPVLYFMTERQRWAAFGPTWLAVAA